MQCNDCKDIIQTYGPSYTHDTHSINLVLAFNIGLMLFYYLQHRSKTHDSIKPLVITALMLLLFDCVLHMTTTCHVNTNYDDDVTTTATIQPWRIISKRVVLSGLVTLFVLQDSDIPLGFRWVSVGCTLFVAASEILSRRHYTVDILLTVVLSYLGFRVAGKYYGNAKSTITK